MGGAHGKPLHNAAGSRVQGIRNADGPETFSRPARLVKGALVQRLARTGDLDEKRAMRRSACPSAMLLSRPIVESDPAL